MRTPFTEPTIATDSGGEPLGVARLVRHAFTLEGEVRPLRERWCVSAPISKDTYDHIRTHASTSVLSTWIIPVASPHHVWVLEFRVPGLVSRYILLLAGHAVADMLSELVNLPLNLFLETRGGEVIDIRVPTPETLVCNLAEQHQAELGTLERCLAVLRTSAMLLSKDEELKEHDSIPRIVVTLVVPSDLERMIFDGYCSGSREHDPEGHV